MLKTISANIKSYTVNTGFRGFAAVVIFLFMLWTGIDDFLERGEPAIFFYFAGIIISATVRGKLTASPEKFSMALRIFILSAVTAGFAKSIPVVELFAMGHHTAISCVFFLLTGFFIAGNFIVYSAPGIAGPDGNSNSR